MLKVAIIVLLHNSPILGQQWTLLAKVNNTAAKDHAITVDFFYLA